MGEPSLPPPGAATAGRRPMAASLRRARRLRRFAFVSMLARLDTAAADLAAGTLEEAAAAVRRRAAASVLGAPPGLGGTAW
eukprot:15454052-Alexandrium_andersonii.AAC.1